MKKLFSALMILLLLAAFVSCNEPEPEATEQPAPETEAPAAKPTLVENGEAAYAIILPEGSSGDMREAVNAFASDLSKLYGVKFEVKKNKALASGKKMLMIGAQEDETYASYYASVPYNKYEIKLTDDGNVAIVAWSVRAIGDVCTKLMMRLESSFAAGDTLGTLSEDLIVSGKESGVMEADIPQYSPTQMPWLFRIQGARGAYELCFKSSKISDWKAYCELLSSSGFEEMQKNENADASFAVYVKDGVEVTVDFWQATGELVILVDKPDPGKPLLPESVSATTVPKLIEPGLEYDGALKGMCYLLQASDGSFVIIDSGDSDPKFLDRLYSTMTSLIPNGEKLHIRAWFLSHQHSDHVNGLVDISTSAYAAKIKCDAVYSNMPYSAYQTAYDNSTYENRFDKIEKAAEKLGADFVTAHTGQTYYFADIEICVIGSVDDMLVTAYDDLDQTSLVMTVQVGSKKLIFSGDAGPVYIGQYINKRYTAQTLKCDIVQATSHGQNGDALTDYYKMADADVYLWPATQDFYNRHTPNKYIKGDSTAKIVYSYDGQYIAELN